MIVHRALCICIILIAVSSPDAIAHGGRLDGIGCHHNQKAGNYHCHRGELNQQIFGSKEEALAALNSSDKPHKYSRKLYRHWIDEDGDCQSTRNEVLIEESLVPVSLDLSGCKVISGKWRDLYSGKVFTSPRNLDIDHMIPLAEAHRSGAAAWSSEQKKLFANDLSDPDALIAVSASENRSKGDKDPAHWLPSNSAFHCEYIARWKNVKNKWGLGLDAQEAKAVNEMLDQCSR